MKNIHKGSTFDSFLENEGLLDQTEATAVKRIIAHQIEQAMKKQHITKKEDGRHYVYQSFFSDRLLDPENVSVTLQSLVNAAHALGKKIQISFAK